MARPAPAVDRVVAVLEFLATRPDEAFGVSELARRLDLNKATAHATMTALSAQGWLRRHPTDRTYQLGSALVAIGNAAARRSFDVVDSARPMMQELADELGIQCVASTVLGDEIVMLARTGTPQPVGLSVQVGQRVPLAPPLGTVFLAWSSADAIDGWLRRLGADADEADLARYRAAIRAVQRRGYSLAREGEARIRLDQTLAAHDDAEPIVAALGHEEYILLELERAASYRLSMIAAPVFDAAGRVTLALTLLGFPEPLAGPEVPQYAGRLRAAARDATRAIEGVDPTSGDGGP